MGGAGGGFACAAQVDSERFQGFTEANGNVCAPTSAQAAVCGRLVLIAALHKYVESSRALPAQLEHLQVQSIYLFINLSPPPPLPSAALRLASNVKHQDAKRRFSLFTKKGSLVGICSKVDPVLRDEDGSTQTVRLPDERIRMTVTDFSEIYTV